MDMVGKMRPALLEFIARETSAGIILFIAALLAISGSLVSGVLGFMILRFARPAH